MIFKIWNMVRMYTRKKRFNICLRCKERNKKVTEMIIKETKKEGIKM